MEVVLVILLALLAFANGANDNCKGVATLVGTGTAKPRPALIWATISTALGAAFSFWAAGGLVRSFSTGLFAPGTSLDSSFYGAVLFGAFGWVIVATRTGLPVSTTHAITGALTGAGLVAFGADRLEWEFLGARFAAPLAISPLLSLGAVFLVSWPVAGVIRRTSSQCACVTNTLTINGCPASAVALQSSRLGVVVDAEARCATPEVFARISASSTMSRLHWLSSGFVGFARGWNDAPKIAALGLVALPESGGMPLAFAIVTASMAAGGLLTGRRVLITLATRIAPLPLPESIAASLTTGALVGLASWNGLPVSTTHVSTGAIIGAGLRSNARAVRWSKVGEIGLSWFLTLPTAAILSASALTLLRLAH